MHYHLHVHQRKWSHQLQTAEHEDWNRFGLSSWIIGKHSFTQCARKTVPLQKLNVSREERSTWVVKVLSGRTTHILVKPSNSKCLRHSLKLLSVQQPIPGFWKKKKRKKKKNPKTKRTRHLSYVVDEGQNPTKQLVKLLALVGGGPAHNES